MISVSSIYNLLNLIFADLKQHLSSVADSVKSCLDPLLLQIVALKCSFQWLTTLPIQKQGFYLNKQDFFVMLQVLDFAGNCMMSPVTVFVTSQMKCSV